MFGGAVTLSTIRKKQKPPKVGLKNLGQNKKGVLTGIDEYGIFIKRKGDGDMLINKDIPAEVRAYINASGKKKVEIARGIGVTPMRLNSILTYTKMLEGDEKWILALDEAGYDVEVKIKPKPKK